MKSQDYSTMAEAIKGLQGKGYTVNFEYLHHAFCAVDTGETYQPQNLTICEHHRFEGASDPDDQSIIYAIETEDGKRGIIVDAYGIYANSELEAFLEQVNMQEDR